MPRRTCSAPGCRSTSSSASATPVRSPRACAGSTTGSAGSGSGSGPARPVRAGLRATGWGSRGSASASEGAAGLAALAALLLLHDLLERLAPLLLGAELVAQLLDLGLDHPALIGQTDLEALDLGALPAALPPGEGGRAEGQADQERHQGTEHARAVHEAPSSQCFAMAGAVDPAASTLMRIE